MSFDPNFPQENTIADAPMMRAQLLALNDKIESVPASDMAAFLARLSAILRLNFTGPHVPNNPYAAGDVASFNDVVVRYVLALDDMASSPQISFPIPWPWILIPIELGQMLAAGSSANSNAVATLDTPYADPAAEELRQKMNEILLAMRR